MTTNHYDDIIYNIHIRLSLAKFKLYDWICVKFVKKTISPKTINWLPAHNITIEAGQLDMNTANVYIIEVKFNQLFHQE